MVDYPVNYEKPDLLNYIVDFIFDSGDVENWRELDLGEWIIEEVDLSNVGFQLTSAQYAMLCEEMDKAIKDKMEEYIEREIADRVESAKEWREVKEEAKRIL